MTLPERYHRNRDEDEPSWDEDEQVDDYGDLDDDSAETVPCPYCRAPIYEEAEQCPECGNYVVHTTAYLWSGRSWWWIAIGLFGIIAVILMSLFVGP